ncbi:MAG: cation diffusion facilitator family transporter, partial [Anaerolineae bacterium]|nr:cation diffusion facilitator family transporter [Anaerolineae bacterium]
MRWIRELPPGDHRQKNLYRNALTITLVGNILLAACKAVAAYLSGSVALYADAANSISDVLYSIMVVIGLYIAQQPPDISHPQGHSRFEPLMGLVISLSMAYAGYEALSASYERFTSGGMAIDAGLPTVVLLLSAAVKAGMFASISQISRSLHSPTLEAAAQDNLSDVLTSSAAFVGTIGSAFIHPLLDPLAGFLVALWIFRG